MALRDDILASFERMKATLRTEQGYTELGRRTISRDVTPVQYVNGRVMFDAQRTQKLQEEYNPHVAPSFLVRHIAQEMRTLELPSSLTVGYTLNTQQEPVFVFVALQD